MKKKKGAALAVISETLVLISLMFSIMSTSVLVNVTLNKSKNLNCEIKNEVLQLMEDIEYSINGVSGYSAILSRFNVLAITRGYSKTSGSTTNPFYTKNAGRSTERNISVKTDTVKGYITIEYYRKNPLTSQLSLYCTCILKNSGTNNIYNITSWSYRI